MKAPDDTLDTSDGVTMQRLSEWTEFLYRQHLRRVGGLPNIAEQERLRKGVRTLAIRVIKDDEQAWAEVMRLYGGMRQGPRLDQGPPRLRRLAEQARRHGNAGADR